MKNQNQQVVIGTQRFHLSAKLQNNKILFSLIAQHPKTKQYHYYRHQITLSLRNNSNDQTKLIKYFNHIKSSLLDQSKYIMDMGRMTLLFPLIKYSDPNTSNGQNQLYFTFTKIYLRQNDIIAILMAQQCYNNNSNPHNKSTQNKQKKKSLTLQNKFQGTNATTKQKKIEEVESKVPAKKNEEKIEQLGKPTKRVKKENDSQVVTPTVKQKVVNIDQTTLEQNREPNLKKQINDKMDKTSDLKNMKSDKIEEKKIVQKISVTEQKKEMSKNKIDNNKPRLQNQKNQTEKLKSMLYQSKELWPKLKQAESQRIVKTLTQKQSKIQNTVQGKNSKDVQREEQKKKKYEDQLKRSQREKMWLTDRVSKPYFLLSGDHAMCDADNQWVQIAVNLPLNKQPVASFKIQIKETKKKYICIGIASETGLKSSCTQPVIGQQFITNFQVENSRRYTLGNFSKGDIVQVCIEWQKNKITWNLNQIKIVHMDVQDGFSKQNYYPCIEMKTKGDVIKWIG